MKKLTAVDEQHILKHLDGICLRIHQILHVLERSDAAAELLPAMKAMEREIDNLGPEVQKEVRKNYEAVMEDCEKMKGE